jgi:hypothetical protein
MMKLCVLERKHSWTIFESMFCSVSRSVFVFLFKRQSSHTILEVNCYQRFCVFFSQTLNVRKGHGVVVSTPVLYSGGSGFKYRSVGQLYWQAFKDFPQSPPDNYRYITFIKIDDRVLLCALVCPYVFSIFEYRLLKGFLLNLVLSVSTKSVPRI